MTNVSRDSEELRSQVYRSRQMIVLAGLICMLLTLIFRSDIAAGAAGGLGAALLILEWRCFRAYRPTQTNKVVAEGSR